LFAWFYFTTSDSTFGSSHFTDWDAKQEDPQRQELWEQVCFSCCSNGDPLAVSLPSLVLLLCSKLTLRTDIILNMATFYLMQDWDDDNLEDDFSQRLKAELAKRPQ
jgi:hypothetical protein